MRYIILFYNINNLFFEWDPFKMIYKVAWQDFRKYCNL